MGGKGSMLIARGIGNNELLEAADSHLVLFRREL